MILSMYDGREIQQPSQAELDSAIRSLEANQFIILSKDSEQYMQSYLNEDGTWDLEYRKGSADEHYAADGSIDADTVVSAFQSYASGDDFESLVLWFRLELPEYDETDPALSDGWEGINLDDDLDWQQDIDASQSMPELELKGAIYQRLPHGSETYHEAEVFSNCEECNVLPKQYHVLGCEQEECPLCSGLLMECNCLDIETADADESDAMGGSEAEA